MSNICQCHEQLCLVRLMGATCGGRKCSLLPEYMISLPLRSSWFRPFSICLTHFVSLGTILTDQWSVCLDLSDWFVSDLMYVVGAQGFRPGCLDICGWSECQWRCAACFNGCCLCCYTSPGLVAGMCGSESGVWQFFARVGGRFEPCFWV